MALGIDQLLPQIQSLGVLGYWAIGAGSMLESFFLTGIVIPGTLIVEAGGILVGQGVLDFFDLVWFVAIGSILGCEASFWVGRMAGARIKEGSRLTRSRAFQRAQDLFARRGGLALVMGRFLGPVSGLVPLAAALAGMDRRKVLMWNIIGSIPYALVQLGIGLAIGGVLGQIGPMASRVTLVLVVLAAVVFLVWWLIFRILRLLPLGVSLLESLSASLGEHPAVAGVRARHPQASRWIVGRFDKSHFYGLPLTMLTLVFAYLFAVWVDSLLEFIFAAPILSVDPRVAELIHAFWSPTLLRVAAYVTALGDPKVVGVLAAALVVWLLVQRRTGLALAVLVAVGGDVVSVSLLKHIFARPRPELAYFVETSGSFPSGHAAISIAFFGTVAFVLWRLRAIGAATAIVLASLTALLIGASRLYLNEHFLSDVMNGWLVGGLWLTVAVAATEWWQATHESAEERASPVALRVVAGVLLAGAVGMAGWTVATYDKAHAIPPAPAQDMVLADPGTLFAQGAPTTTETLLGTPVGEINAVLLASDEASLLDSLGTAGWSQTALPGPSRLISIAYDAAFQETDPTAPLTPHFWSGRPSDLRVERQVGTDWMLAELWQTRVLSSGGQRLYVVAVRLRDLPDAAEAGQANGPSPLDQFTSDLIGAGAQTEPATAAQGRSVATLSLP